MRALVWSWQGQRRVVGPRCSGVPGALPLPRQTPAGPCSTDSVSLLQSAFLNITAIFLAHCWRIIHPYLQDLTFLYIVILSPWILWLWATGGLWHILNTRLSTGGEISCLPTVCEDLSISVLSHARSFVTDRMMGVSLQASGSSGCCNNMWEQWMSEAWARLPACLFAASQRCCVVAWAGKHLRCTGSGVIRARRLPLRTL